MAGLQFSFAELIQETEFFKRIARPVLDRTTLWSLDEFASSLRSVQGSGHSGSQRLKLREFYTRLSRDYDRHPGRPVQAIVSGDWDLSRVGGRRGRQIVEFSGIASLRIAVHEVDCCAEHAGDGESGGNRPRDVRSRVFQCSSCSRGACVASWKLDLGRQDSPGCYFHCHVLADGPTPPFPDWLPIRLPSLFATPLAAVEFSLGELFQEEWAKKLASKGAGDAWRRMQEKRLGRLLEWLRSDAMSQGALSPWMNLKAAKPPEDLFVR